MQCPQGQQVEVFLDRDRAYAARKLGIHTSKLVAALRQAHLALETTAQRSSGTVVVSWQEVVQLRFDQDTRQVAVMWDQVAAAAAGVDVAATMAGRHAAVAAAGPERPGQRG